jgi:hypothetical protein
MILLSLVVVNVIEYSVCQYNMNNKQNYWTNTHNQLIILKFLPVFCWMENSGFGFILLWETEIIFYTQSYTRVFNLVIFVYKIFL